ncbi:MAG TPA: type II secretion system protein [Ignavibacteriales bacterium]|nr:type II secretion system protein [Ignavibacteriales bacterium]HEX3073005.1 type II secretion system protein [Ignavibacteriales bacterium]
MKIISRNEGYTIIEALVGIVILGLILVFTVSVFNRLFANPQLLLKGEALYLADQEIKHVINDKDFETLEYESAGRNMLVRRTVSEGAKLYEVQVSVIFKGTGKEIVSLSVEKRK